MQKIRFVWVLCIIPRSMHNAVLCIINSVHDPSIHAQSHSLPLSLRLSPRCLTQLRFSAGNALSPKSKSVKHSGSLLGRESSGGGAWKVGTSEQLGFGCGLAMGTKLGLGSTVTHTQTHTHPPTHTHTHTHTNTHNMYVCIYMHNTLNYFLKYLVGSTVTRLSGPTRTYSSEPCAAGAGGLRKRSPDSGARGGRESAGIHRLVSAFGDQASDSVRRRHISSGRYTRIPDNSVCVSVHTDRANH